MNNFFICFLHVFFLYFICHLFSFAILSFKPIIKEDQSMQSTKLPQTNVIFLPHQKEKPKQKRKPKPKKIHLPFKENVISVDEFFTKLKEKN